MKSQSGTAVTNPKQVAGAAAARLVEDGMVVGLGTGSTVYFTLVALAERIATETLRIQGVPTSIDTENKARDMGIPLVGLDRVASIDLTIDGADEADHGLRLTKGGGGALLREKVVASISNEMVVVMTPDKLVERLGKSFALPIESVPFAGPMVERELARTGCEPVLRLGVEGKPYLTDNHNQIFDCTYPDGIADPKGLESHLAGIPGIVESGLFIDLANRLYMGSADGSCDIRVRS